MPEPKGDAITYERIRPPADVTANRLPLRERSTIRNAAISQGVWDKFSNNRASRKRELIESGMEDVPAARIAFWDTYQTVFPDGVMQSIVVRPRKRPPGRQRKPAPDEDGADVENATYSFEELASRIPLDRKATVIDEIDFAASNAFTRWSVVCENPDLVPSRRALIFLKMAKVDVTDFVKNAMIKALLTDRRLEDERRRAVDADIPVLSDLDEAERALLEERQAEAAKADEPVAIPD